jgi:hypothetical protein
MKVVKVLFAIVVTFASLPVFSAKGYHHYYNYSGGEPTPLNKLPKPTALSVPTLVDKVCSPVSKACRAWDTTCRYTGKIVETGVKYAIPVAAAVAGAGVVIPVALWSVVVACEVVSSASRLLICAATCLPWSIQCLRPENCWPNFFGN